MHFTTFVEAPIKRQACAGIRAVTTVAMAHQAGHAVPEGALSGQHALAIAAALAAHQLRLRLHLNHRAGNGPDAAGPAAGKLLQQPCLSESLDHKMQDLCLLTGIKGLGWFQGALEPVLGPGGRTPLTHQLLETALPPVTGEEQRFAGRASEFWGVPLLIEGEGVGAAAADVRAALPVGPDQFRYGDGALPTPVT